MHGIKRLTAVCCVWFALAAAFPATAPARDSTQQAGDALRIAIPAAALALTVYRRDQQGRRQFYKSFGASALTTAGLKEAFDKERPDGSDGDAFPSGHTSVSFQAAGFIHRRYGIREAWPAYVAASYVGWTRFESDKHDVEDVLAGAAVGIGSAFLLGDRMRGVDVAASFGEDRVVIRVSGLIGGRR